MSDRHERIELYLTDAMSVEEKHRFEQDMEQDPSLKEMVSRMQIIDRALDIAVQDHLRSFLKQLETGPSETTQVASQPKIRNLISRMAVAASVLLVLSIGLWYIFGDGPAGLGQYRDTNYLAYDYTQIRGEYSQRKDFPSGLASGHYDKEETAKWFVTWLNTHPEDYEARFILADIYRQMKQTGRAKAELAIIISSRSVLWGEKAEWNYVLLSTDDTWDDLADATLQKMMNEPAHSYHRQAIELDRMQKK